jgi:hypothetical protein
LSGGLLHLVLRVLLLWHQVMWVRLKKVVWRVGRVGKELRVVLLLMRVPLLRLLLLLLLGLLLLC